MSVEIRPLARPDLEWFRSLMDDHWGGQIQVENGRGFRPAEQDGFVALEDGRRVGVVTYELDGPACRIGLLESLREGRGVGRALVDAVRAEARRRGCDAVRVTTTNENARAQGFYEKLEFVLVEVRPGAVTRSRKIKPTIPSSSEDGTSITDEIEYELRLDR